MRDFAALIEGLAFTPGRNGKLRLIADYLARTPDPARGYGLAALTGDLSFRQVKPAAIRALIAERTDPVLFGWSYDYVGDLAETVSLMWPASAPAGQAPTLTQVVERFAAARRGEVPALLDGWLSALDESGRFALLKLVTGGMRVGVSARLAKLALAEWGKVDINEIEELWHGFEPPYEELFVWLDGRGPRPVPATGLGFRPLMLSNPLDEAALAGMDPAAYRAEYKWDGARVQLAAENNRVRIYSRAGDEISAAFPDLADAAMGLHAVLDGELLVADAGTAPDGVAIRPFNDLQQRLNRKKVTAPLMRTHPAHLRLYDILFEGDEDLRPLPFDARRARLEAWQARTQPDRMDLSPLVPFADWEELAELRSVLRDASVEGLMLKQGDSPYLPGRPKGPWFKWKRTALTLDCVLMYAQRGHGKRSSFYSDFTFGAWRDGEAGRELTPVGKAYFGFTDAELVELDRWVRRNTVNRFGPVREVEPGLVLEVAFDSVQRSRRHKSGLAMRFPRISRIRWEKPAEEADRLESLEAMLPDSLLAGAAPAD
ncbi:cisplatin damage response ATP-dependent DNA ligase [Marinibaculum pumilum]|uniref:DNA ligase (ATP) n=1 Tax=Marinibaculum pumilum TaxID=1766165 RepID=A0ABV7KX79_9PROT